MSLGGELRKRYGLQKLKCVAWKDPLNPENELTAYYENRSGTFIITEVNGIAVDEQLVQSVPKCYPYDTQRVAKKGQFSQIVECKKWSGTALIFYVYTTKKKRRFFSVCRRHGVSVDDDVLNVILDVFGRPFVPPVYLQVAAVKSVCYELISGLRPELVKYEDAPVFKPLFITLSDGMISPVTSDLLDRKARTEVVEEDDREIIMSPYGTAWCYSAERYSSVGSIVYLLNSNGVAERFYKNAFPNCPSSIEFDTYLQFKATCAGQKLREEGKELSRQAVWDILSSFLHRYHWDRLSKDIMSAAMFDRPSPCRNKGDGRGILVVCCGIPGSGKSTASVAIEKELGFLRVNQDTLGSRGRCISEATKALKKGRNVVLDRSNVDINQRNPWMALAAKMNVEKTIALVIATPLQTCIERIWNRKDHPTIPIHSEKAASIANMFARQFFYPTHEEGFDKIIRWEGQTVMELQKLIFEDDDAAI